LNAVGRPDAAVGLVAHLDDEAADGLRRRSFALPLQFIEFVENDVGACDRVVAHGDVTSTGRKQAKSEC
jgi:hypothetical protein